MPCLEGEADLERVDLEALQVLVGGTGEHGAAADGGLEQSGRLVPVGVEVEVE